jgi:hypothetical protein
MGWPLIASGHYLPETSFMKIRAISCAVAALLVSANGAAWAQSAFSDASFSFSGFGTVGLSRTTTDDAEYSSIGIPNGAKKKWTPNTDSKLGLQGSAKLNSMFSGTVQVISKHNVDGNFSPKLEWAFAKAQVLPSLALRAGRIAAPFFAVSDFRDVNYANLWVRPPYDVYAQVPLSFFDGADGIYQTTLGSATINFQAFYGVSRGKITGLEAKGKGMQGVNITAEFDNGITLRVGTSNAVLNVDNPRLTGLLNGLKATQNAGLADGLALDGKLATFSGVGIGYDRDNWIGSAEFTVKRLRSFISDTSSWHVTAGHRFGTWTPYVMLSGVRVDDPNVVNTVPTTSPQLAGLSGAVSALLASQNTAQKDKALGVRWDFRKNLALKAQIDHITPDGGKGMFNAAAAGFGKESVNVYAVNLDFVF